MKPEYSFEGAVRGKHIPNVTPPRCPNCREKLPDDNHCADCGGKLCSFCCEEKDVAGLHDYATASFIREATPNELKRSIAAAKLDGGAGVIDVDGRSCYVVGDLAISCEVMEVFTVGEALQDKFQDAMVKAGLPASEAHPLAESMMAWCQDAIKKGVS